MRTFIRLFVILLVASPIVVHSQSPRGAGPISGVVICHHPPGSPGEPKTLTVPAHVAERLIAGGSASPGPCPAVLQCDGESREVTCTDVLVLDEAAIRDSQDSEQILDLFLQPGRPEIEFDLTSVPPRPSVMAQCIEDRLAEEPVVGFAYSIFQDGSEASSGAGGWARAPWENNSPSIPMTAQKPMTLASISKIITAVALFRLLEQHPDIDLDDPFYPLIEASWSGPFELGNGLIVNIPGPGLENVTLRHLVIHRSGLETSLSCGNIVELLGIGTVGTPGVTFSYENHNFCLLRLVIEEVSGMNYVQYVQDNVLAPMGIAMDCMPEAVDPTLYYNTVMHPGKHFGDYTATCSAYGWTGSATQIARLMAGFRLDEVLAPATRERMLTECPFEGEPDGDRCLGFVRSTSVIGEHYYHGGLWQTGDFCKSEPGGLIAFQPSKCRKGFRGHAVRMPLGIDATLFFNTLGGTGVNPSLPDTLSVLRQCFKEAFLEANPAP